MLSIIVLLLNCLAYNQPATYLFDAGKWFSPIFLYIFSGSKKIFPIFTGLKFYWWFCILSLYEVFKQEALQPPPEESKMSMVQCNDEPNPDYASIP